MKKAILISSLLLLACPFLANGRIIIVNDDGPADFNNIQAAIDDANDGDTIYVFPGTYRGFGNRDIDFGGKAVTVRGTDPNNPNVVAATVIDCEANEADLHRGFVFLSGEDGNSVLDGLTITNGVILEGGGIYCSDSGPTIKNCILSDNSAVAVDFTAYGGAIYCSGGNPAIVNCTIVGNTSGWNLGYGGGIYCRDASPLIKDCYISGNTARHYGGIACFGGCATIANCMVVGNAVWRKGGGIGMDNGRITNCIIQGNSAAKGGGIETNVDTAGALYIVNCVLSSNTASEQGGAVRNLGASPDIINCTIVGNLTTGEGGGIWNWSAYRQYITNSILWGNADPNGTDESAQIFRGTPTASFSCIQDDDPNDANVPFGGADNNNIDDYPIFVRDPNDGGDGWGDDPATPAVNEALNDDFGDLHLMPGSPCIDSGVPAMCLGSDLVDMDGEPRVMGAVVDMGADEFPISMITTIRPGGGEVWAAGSKHVVVWVSAVYAGTVDILLSINGGGSFEPIAAGIADVGTYLWQVPEIIDSNQCLITVVPTVPDPNVICVASELFTIHPDSPDPQVPSRWKTLGGDFKRSGLSAYPGPELACVKWVFETNAPVSASPTVGGDGRIHLACEDGKLYTLDANGILLWSHDTNSPLISAPTIGPDGTLYVGSEAGILYAIDAQGDLRWTHTTDGPVYSSPAVSPDGQQIYVCSTDGVLDALGRDGSEMWSFETGTSGSVGGSVFGSPAVAADGTVYVPGYNDANLYALDPNGTCNWICHFASGGTPFSSPVVAADAAIYQTLLHDPNLYAIDPCDGAIMWTVKIPQLPPLCGDGFRDNAIGWSEPALGSDGTIYASIDDPNLAAVDPNGTIKWASWLGLGHGSALTVGGDGLIYAAGDYGWISVFDSAGRELWCYRSDSASAFPPVVADENTLLVADANNRILALTGEGCDEQPLVLHRPDDLNGDSFIDFGDFGLLASDWGDCEAQEEWYWCWPPALGGAHPLGDIDRSRCVDFADMARIAQRWLTVIE